MLGAAVLVRHDQAFPFALPCLVILPAFTDQIVEIVIKVADDLHRLLLNLCLNKTTTDAILKPEQ